MMTPLTKPVTAVQVAAYLKRHLPQARPWPRAKILPWVEWFLRTDRALVLTDESDRIRGVALGRFVPSVEAVRRRPHLFDMPGAAMLWVDAVATSHAAAMPQLVLLLVAKYGPRETVAGECFSREGELRMFPIKTLQRFFGGLKS